MIVLTASWRLVQGEQTGSGERGLVHEGLGTRALCLGLRDLDNNLSCSGPAGVDIFHLMERTGQCDYVYEGPPTTDMKNLLALPSSRVCVPREPGWLLVKFAHKPSPGE